jgi:hypothetical protein
VGVHVGIKICEKPPADAAKVMTVAECQEGALRLAVLVITDLWRLGGGFGKSYSLSKKVSKRY